MPVPDAAVAANTATVFQIITMRVVFALAGGISIIPGTKPQEQVMPVPAERYITGAPIAEKPNQVHMEPLMHIIRAQDVINATAVHGPPIALREELTYGTDIITFCVRFAVEKARQVNGALCIVARVYL